MPLMLLNKFIFFPFIDLSLVFGQEMLQFPIYSDCTMYSGKLVFPQLFDHLPLHSFRHCVRRYRGNHKLRSFHCLEQYLCMAFGQLACRESLRDIEACPRFREPLSSAAGVRGKLTRSGVR